MTKITAILSGALLAVALLSSATAAELGGKWTTDGRYVFSFARVGDAWTGVVTEAGSGREFKLADIVVVDGAREGTGERAYRAELKRVP